MTENTPLKSSQLNELFNIIEDDDIGDKLVSNAIDDEEEILDDYSGNIIALGIELELTVDDLEDVSKSKYGYGSCLYEIKGNEYYSGDDEEITEALTDYIKDSLWAFNSTFLGDYGALKNMYHSDVEVILGPLQEKCEDGNNAIKVLVNWDDNSEEIVSDAWSSDGMGHFLNSYDGYDSEVTVNKVTYYVCRT